MTVMTRLPLRLGINAETGWQSRAVEGRDGIADRTEMMHRPPEDVPRGWWRGGAPPGRAPES